MLCHSSVINIFRLSWHTFTQTHTYIKTCTTYGKYVEKKRCVCVIMIMTKDWELQPTRTTTNVEVQDDTTAHTHSNIKVFISFYLSNVIIQLILIFTLLCHNNNNNNNTMCFRIFLICFKLLQRTLSLTVVLFIFIHEQCYTTST